MINPSNIHCLALNFIGVGDNDEVPLYFVKSRSSLCYSGSSIKYPLDIQKMWTEVELGIVVQDDCHDIEPVDAASFIAGYTVCADITCSNLYGRDHHLAFSKSRDNFCPVLDSCLMIDPSLLPGLRLSTQINGTETQAGLLSEMKYDAFHSLSFVSKLTTLKKGDIILTGTPKGVENNVILPGDHVEQRIYGIGTLHYFIH